MEYLKRLYSKFLAIDAKKRSYIIVGLLAIVVMAWAFISTMFITANYSRSQLHGSANDQKLDAIGIIITETKEGHKNFEIYGETGSYSNDNSIATLNNVIGNFYRDDKVAMSFQSSKGTYDEKNKVITLYENTYIVLDDLTSLQTDKLIWSGQDKDTIADGNVIIKKNNDMVATAEKGIIMAGYEHFKIIGNTNTKLYSEKGAE